jgi:hypothetical protein
MMLAARLWPRFALGLIEGLYLQAFVPPRLTSGSSFGIGIVVGAAQLGFRDACTESMYITTVFLALGIVFTGIAARATVGLAVGDMTATLGRELFRAEDAASPFWSAIITAASLAVVYTLLASLAVFIPMSARSVADGTRLPRLLQRRWYTIVAARFSIAALLTVALVWVWVHTAPLLSRPVFTWRGRTPPSISPGSASLEGFMLPIVAAGACAFRAALGRAVPALKIPPDGNDVVRGQIRDRMHRDAKWSRWVRIILRTSQMTFILSGLCAGIADALILAVILGSYNTVRNYNWNQRSHLVARLRRTRTPLRIGLWIFAVLLSAWVLTATGAAGSWPAILMVAVSLLVASVFFGPVEMSRPK